MNDYREVQSYLSHGLFDKKKKQYYKTEATTAPKRPVGTWLLPRERVQKALDDGTLSTDAIYRGAYSNRASGKAVYQKKYYGWPIVPIPESDEDYEKRTKKYAVDVGQATHNVVKSYNSQLKAKKDIDRATVRMQFTKPVRESANALVDLYEQRNNVVSDLGKASSASNYQAKQQLLKKKEKLDAEIKKKADELKENLWNIKRRADSNSITNDERKALNDILNSSEALGIIGELQAKKAAQLFHSSLEEEYMNSEYTEINAYLQHGLFDIFKSKPKYNSAGSAAGMPTNIHLGDSYNPTAKASAIQDEIVRMSKKLAEYENGEVKAKADYDRYKKLVKETKARLSDLEKARATTVTQSVNSNTKQTTVTSSVPNKTRLVRTNPIFDRDVANLRKKR